MKYSTKVKSRFELFEKILGIYSVSSYEEELGIFLKDYYESLGYTVAIDNVGNVIASNKKNPAIALISHMDTVGFMVVKEEEEGRYKLNTLGGPDFENLVDAVCFSEGKEIDGLLYRNEGKNSIGFFEPHSRKMSGKIEPGDLITYKKYFNVEEDVVTSPFLDDKSSVFITMLIAELLKDEKHDFLFCHTVREEFGGLGSKALPYSFPNSVKKAVILDIVFANCPLYKAEPIVGDGAGICFKDSSSGERKVIKELISIARKKNIPHQIEIVTGGGSDMSNIYWQNGGIQTGYVGVPIKNCHTCREIISIEDVTACMNLLICYEQEWENTE